MVRQIRYGIPREARSSRTNQGVANLFALADDWILNGFLSLTDRLETHHDRGSHRSILAHTHIENPEEQPEISQQHMKDEETRAWNRSDIDLFVLSACLREPAFLQGARIFTKKRRILRKSRGFTVVLVRRGSLLWLLLGRTCCR